MNHFTQPQLFISAKAKNLGVQLIKDLQISMAADLELFLDVNPCFNGHQAVMIWVHPFLGEIEASSSCEERILFKLS